MVERCLQYVRIFPGAEPAFDRLHAEIPPDVSQSMADSGLHDVSGFRRGTDVWRYPQVEPDRETALGLYAHQPASRARSHQFRDIIAEIEAPEGGLTWYGEIFHTGAPPTDGPFERALFSLVIDPDRADAYDELHANL
jgi:L-rhamnose mutarotase